MAHSFIGVPGGAHMAHLVRDFVDLQDRVSLDDMIAQLTAARAALPADVADATVRMHGDDVFGRRLTISYLRPPTAEEAARYGRYDREIGIAA